eukprot:GFUD01009226.1.p1 GENE.GFUD01009226.1~~GFUD01009226.1.p1  ORF type:complete len:505 (+),score=144.88 GFUD01009226.1:72-1586(+)
MISLKILLSILLLQAMNSEAATQYTMWGPGLKPDTVILPCRYFFVERGQEESEDVLENSKDKLSVSIEGVSDNNRICRPHTEVFDRPSGFLVRYKVFYACKDIQISVKINGEHILGSPVKIENVAQADTCDCPRQTLEDWIVENDCPAPPKQMDDDLKQFVDEGVDMRVALEKAKNTFNHGGTQCWCHYAVKDGEIFRQCYGQHVGFSMFWDNVLNWLARRALLPDLEMLVNLGDWPLVKTAHRSIPMFSWCGSSSTQDMVFPTYELTEASLECMGRQSLDVLSSMGKNQVPWDQKIEKLFWRGRDSRRERLKLVELGKEYPDAINASITAFFFFREEEARLGRSPYVSFFDFFDHKYQLNIDGTVAAYRLPYLLSGNGVVFKQESSYYEHFYSELQPWEHYIPVAQDLSDLLERIEWAKQNDMKAKKISENAQKFAEDHLLPQNVLCYHAQLLSRWAGLIKNKVELGEGMEKVEKMKKTDGRFGSCTCADKIDLKRSSSKDEL